MHQITDELRHALQATHDRGPVTLFDPLNDQKYVLLREDVYDRLRALLVAENFDIRETYAAQDAAAESAWSHPDDAAYDTYDAHRRAMNVHRGDIVLVTLPFAQGIGSKLRPALVVQHDVANGKLTNTIVVAITRNINRAHLETQLLVDPSTAAGKSSGLIATSAVTCENLFTVGQNLIQRIIGHLPSSAMRHVNDCLKAALEIP